MRKVFALLTSLLIVLSLFGCKPKTNGEVTIVYTNDIHTHINNTKTDDNGNEIKLLNYGSIKALKDDLIASGKQVLLLDVGDHIQGTAYGGIDSGESIVKIVNAVGYDAATLGNHEFDYGQQQVFNLINNIATYPFLSCNFYSISDNKLVLEPYKIFEKDGLKIAVIGISTPETISKSMHKYFEDENGNSIYDFYGTNGGQELYDVVQKTIDEVKKKADVVVALGHLGIEETSTPCRSIDVIANTTGIDAFIDAHSHHYIDSQLVKDKDGKDVLLTQTGEYLANIGVMNISVNDGIVSISTEMINEYDKTNPAIDEMSDELIARVQAEDGKVICANDVDLIVKQPNTEERIVRKLETNAGDFCADAFYWYFNEIEQIDTDVAIFVGGAVRSEISAGDITYADVKQVMPFSNIACAIEVSGQTLLDALEFSSRVTDGVPKKTNESGGFIQIAGARFTIDTTIESTIGLSDNQDYASCPSDEYRVKNLQIYNKKTGTYEDVDLNKNYTLVGVDYTLRNFGDGYKMFSDGKLVKDYCNEDYMVAVKYCEAFTNKTINTNNSPLHTYKGYLLDYENPYGAGRITFVK